MKKDKKKKMISDCNKNTLDFQLKWKKEEKKKKDREKKKLKEL